MLFRSSLMMEFTVGPYVPTEEFVHDVGTGEFVEKEENQESDPMHHPEDREETKSDEQPGEKPPDGSGVNLAKEDLEQEMEEPDEGQPRTRRSRRRRRKEHDHSLAVRFLISRVLPAWCAMVATDATVNQVEGGHIETDQKDAMQQVAGPEPGKSIVPPDEVRRAVGPDLDEIGRAHV